MADTYVGEAGEGKVTLPGGPFSPYPARGNPRDWCPMIDQREIYPGNRGPTRHGAYELYDAPLGVSFRLEEADKSDPLLVSETEWEGGRQLGIGGSVWRNNAGQYRMIYPRSGENKDDLVGYATSDDGYNWIRPNLGQVEFNGSKNNNILVNGPRKGTFEDPMAPPEERFKSMACERLWIDPDNGEIVPLVESEKRYAAMEYQGASYKGPRVQLRGRVRGWVSPDRINWRKIKKPLADFPSDNNGQPQYDCDKGIYFVYLRPHGLPPEATNGVGTGIPEVGIGRRAIGISRTRDFRNWSQPNLVLFPDNQDPLDMSFYGSNYFSYPGRKDLHCMFLDIYHQITDHVDVQIAFSHDGLMWNRPERRPIIPVGSSDSGEGGMVYTVQGGLVQLPDGYWAAAYYGMSQLHNISQKAFSKGLKWPQPGQIRWARWQPHRFCGIEANNEGRFTIPTIYRTQKKLRLNYRCAPGGWVQAELLNNTPSRLHPDAYGLNGFTFEECDRLTGDSLDKAVTWNGGSDISGVGDWVAIRLKMFQAKVFAYRV